MRLNIKNLLILKKEYLHEVVCSNFLGEFMKWIGQISQKTLTKVDKWAIKKCENDRLRHWFANHWSSNQ